MIRYKHLDSLRGLSILFVVLYHTYARWDEYLPHVELTKDIPFFKYGYLGVNMFFMISGFVIFLSLDNSTNLIEFLKKRWIRLFPGMFIASLVIGFLSIIFPLRPNGVPDLLDFIPGIIFVNHNIINMMFGLDLKSLEGSFWSLYVEVIFYIIAGFIFFITRRSSLLPALILISIFSSFQILFVNSRLLNQLIYGLGLNYYFWFAFGCFVYEKINQRTNFLHLVLVCVCFVLMALSEGLYLFKTFIFISLCLLFYFTFLVLSLQKLLSNKILLYFGLISYPLYLVHENTVIAILRKSEIYFSGVEFSSYLVISILAILLMISLATVIEKSERKIITLLKKQEQRKDVTVHE